MPLPPSVTDLITRFADNAKTYTSPDYNETQLRREFLDPLFEALGWDLTNKLGYADAYKDVIHEDSIKVAGPGGGTKAPDYCFRIGGTRKFFLEAKKPSIDIKGDPSPAYQLRRYAWSAKLPISVLSDFEEFAIYDTRIKPDVSDKSSAARIFYCRYTDFPEKWDQIAAILSKEAILKGAFDKYAEGAKAKRGTAEVDDAFLREIEGWRDALASNIALRNPKISERDLNFAVTKTIDRIVFLRICEDRGIEQYAQLQTIAKTNDIYGELLKLFRRADEKYNSGLFHFSREKDRPEEPDTLTPDLDIDDKTLRPILASLYYPDCPYEFSVLPADILGHVYEQFLGKVIRLTAGHRAKVEEKPEVRKAGGVYYTPTYIVDYIVQNTLGKLLGDPHRTRSVSAGPSPAPAGGSPPAQAANDTSLAPGITPKDAAKLKVLDPACGSGSFLLGAYQYLLDWHLRYYLAHDPESFLKQKNPPIYVTPKSTEGHPYRLTLNERKRILLNNIHGVDIDHNAVETTKLSLLLKALEGESEQSIANQLKLFHRERALPDLANNIKCGNSLIGPDFYDNQQLSLLDEETRFKINAFDWSAEFPGVLKAGGFDAVIGNPPYVRQEAILEIKPYLETHYVTFSGTSDLYAFFLEKGVHLLRDRGLFSIVVSSSFLRAGFAAKLRMFLANYADIHEFLDFGGIAVFENAKDTYVCIPLITKKQKTDQVTVTRLRELPSDLMSWVNHNAYTVPSSRLQPEAYSLERPETESLWEKMQEGSVPLGKYIGGKFFRGIVTGLNDAFVVDDATRDELVAMDRNSTELLRPFLKGEDVRRYHLRHRAEWLIFARRGVDISKYPAIQNHLNHWKADLRPKTSKDDQRGRKPGTYKWFEIQDDIAYFRELDKPKIVLPDITKGPRFHLDSKGHYPANTVYCLGSSDLFLLGLLNTRLLWFAVSQVSIPFGTRAGEYRYRLFFQYIEKLPIRVPIPSQKTSRDRIAQLVDNMLTLHGQLATAKTGREQIQRQIDAIDKQIDALVYQLYGLTDDEIRLVESATGN